MILAFLIESTAMLLFARLLARLCSDPAHRTTLWFTALCALPLMAVAHFAGFGWHPFTQHAEIPASGTDYAAPSTVSPWTMLPIVYGAVTAWLLLRWLTALSSIRKLSRNSRPCRSAQWDRQSTQVAERLQRKPLPVRVHPDIGSPVLLGNWQPRVCIPEYLEHCGESRARQILLHEFAHVRANDALRVQIVDLIVCLLWFQPLIRHACARFRDDMELACDDAVVRAGCDARAYAETLAHCAEQHRQLLVPLLGMAERRSQLLQRVVHILGADARPTAAGVPWSPATMLCGGLCLLSVNLAPQILVDRISDPPDATTAVQWSSPAAPTRPGETSRTDRPVTPMRSAASRRPVAAISDVSSDAEPTSLRTDRPKRVELTVTEAPAVSSQIWQSAKNVAVNDAQRYAVRQSDLAPLTTPIDTRFDEGVNKSREQTAARRERIMNHRVWPWFGRVPL